MTDLASWLLARIAEDEAAARAAYDEASDYRVVGSMLAELHFVNWKPDRVLAECAAKRRIVEHRQRIDRSAADDDWSMGYSDGNYDALLAIAQPYAGADGWDEAWKVET